MKSWIRRVAVFITEQIGPEELHLLAALVLIAIGFWSAWRPGAFLVPGAVLLWIALPQRKVFIDQTPPVKKRSET